LLPFVARPFATTLSLVARIHPSRWPAAVGRVAFLVILGLIAPASASPVAAAQAREPRYTAIDLGLLPGGTSSRANAINNQGQIVGSADTSAGNTHAVLWQHGKVTDLGTLPGGTTSAASAINDQGQIVGSSDARDGQQHAVLWHDGEMVDLGGLPDAAVSIPTAINNQGQIVGYSGRDFDHTRAVLWQDGRIRNLGALPGGKSSQALAITEDGNVVGWSDVPVSPSQPAFAHVFQWQAGSGLHDLGDAGMPRCLEGSPCPIVGLKANNQGEIVATGMSFKRDYTTRRWQHEAWTADVPVFGIVSGLNDQGQVVGFAGAFGEDSPLSWQAATGLFDLPTLPGYAWGGAYAINNRGQIVGWSAPQQGFRPGPAHGVLWQPVGSADRTMPTTDSTAPKVKPGSVKLLDPNTMSITIRDDESGLTDSIQVVDGRNVGDVIERRDLDPKDPDYLKEMTVIVRRGTETDNNGKPKRVHSSLSATDRAGNNAVLSGPNS
jgi:probable HAF family extracellular repeat protein